jgi:hypothetical protein
MKKMLIVLIACFLISIQKGNTQRNYIQGFAIGLPFQSGAGFGNIGFERLNKTRTSAWQFDLNFAVGTLTTDVRVPHRFWLSADKIYLFNKQAKFQNATFFTLFTEVGTRNLTGGRILLAQNGLIFQKTKSFEINPGVGLGKNFSLGRKWHLQAIAAPKLIMAFKKDEYFEEASGKIFKDHYTEINAGYRILFNFCYRLGK